MRDVFNTFCHIYFRALLVLLEQKEREEVEVTRSVSSNAFLLLPLDLIVLKLTLQYTSPRMPNYDI